jgi:hypothetical protein
MNVEEQRPTATWCETCNRLVELDQTEENHPVECPHCRAPLSLTPSAASAGEDEAGPKAPWHFKVLVFGTAGYLIYRLIWFIGWLMHHA